MQNVGKGNWDVRLVKKICIRVRNFLIEKQHLIENQHLTYFTALHNQIKALASARAVKKRRKKAQSRKIRTILPMPIYVFDDSEQKAEFKVKIKPCSHQPNCMKF